ncbi:fatty acid desaturase [Prochlorococcus marinus]|uniref:Fatty acid desaturase, type 2 n=1 Tax=Prochlorococcus marinus (strain MIT 9303) TaxID=59922 RepID=A2CBI3_PROM3|nr:fatty acid desaturase [Prochlorococcus marinus]ABM78843.1 fatty acid desaturase, type 2 [Prochlorococcus marinus str. MIT 9303]
MMSGLNGKALKVSKADIPDLAAIKAVLPHQCLNCSTNTSLAYLAQSLTIQVIVISIGMSIPLNVEILPVWVLYWLVSGTTAMGLWVIAHECGHGAFSKNRKLETFVGYVLHSMLLVPYFSWQRSHLVHHTYTNHIANGETHVPLVIRGNGIDEQAGGEKDIAIAGRLGKVQYGVFQLVLHLVFGWPAYLLTGKTGGPKYGLSNHFWPIAPFSRKLWTKKWINKVWLSDWGICLALFALIAWSLHDGFVTVFAIYLAPLLVVNIWLVTYTWLHHTDTDVPHLGGSDFSQLRGAFLSIDRPYGKVIDFLHHKIGSTHAIHHIAPWMPHYHAGKATIALKNAFPKVYLYNQTPILQALWLISTNCIAVTREENSGRYVWKNPW